MDPAISRVYLRTVALAVLAFLGLLMAYIELAPVNFAAREYAVWSEQLRFARTPSERDPEILLVGDSRVRAALMPTRIDEGVRSLALCGGSTIDGYFLLRDYLAHHRAPRVLVLSYAPYQMHSWNPDVFWNRSVKYSAHGLRDFLALLDRGEHSGATLGPGLDRNASLAQWLLHRARFPLYYLPELRNARVFLRRSRNLEIAEAVRASRGHGHYGWAEESSGLSAETRHDEFAPGPLVTRYLHDTIALATDAGSTVVFRAMPINETSFQRVRSGFTNDYREYVAALVAEHPRLIAVPELDFLPDDHFGDRNHLNPRGAARFSERFRDELEREAGSIALLSMRVEAVPADKGPSAR